MTLRRTANNFILQLQLDFHIDINSFLSTSKVQQYYLLDMLCPQVS